MGKRRALNKYNTYTPAAALSSLQHIRCICSSYGWATRRATPFDLVVPKFTASSEVRLASAAVCGTLPQPTKLRHFDSKQPLTTWLSGRSRLSMSY